MLKRAVFCMFLLWIFFPSDLSAQSSDSSFYIPYRISIEDNYGFIIPHHYYINYLIKSHIPSFNIEFLQRVSGKKEWHHLRHFPLLGAGFYYADLGNEDVFGKVSALYGKIEIPIGKKGIAYSINAGVSYITKTFIPVENNYNTCISSHLNVYFQLAFLYRLHMGPYWTLFPKINITHYSNGNFKEPNTGLNVVSAGIGIRYAYGKERPFLSSDTITKVSEKKWDYSIIGSVGSKATTKEKDAHFFVSDLEIGIHYHLSKITGFTGGIDYFYDGSMESYLRFIPETTFRPTDAHKLGVHLGYEPYWGKTFISIEMGYYIIDRINLEGAFFHRFALNHRFSKHILGGVSLKTHFFKAEYVEWRLGYLF